MMIRPIRRQYPTSFTKGFFDVALRQNPKPNTVAIVAADAEFGLNASDGARENVKAAGLTVVYDRRYPSTTTDLVPVVRAIHHAARRRGLLVSLCERGGARRILRDRPR